MPAAVAWGAGPPWWLVQWGGQFIPGSWGPERSRSWIYVACNDTGWLMAFFSQLPFPQADTEGRCSVSSYYSETLSHALVGWFFFWIRKDLKETSGVALISLILLWEFERNWWGSPLPNSQSESPFHWHVKCSVRTKPARIRETRVLRSDPPVLSFTGPPHFSSQ